MNEIIECIKSITPTQFDIASLIVLGIATICFLIGAIKMTRSNNEELKKSQPMIPIQQEAERRWPRYDAFIPELNITLEGVDVYNDGNIGITYNRLPESFGKLYHVEWDDMSIRENGTYNHVMNILTGVEYIWFESGFELIDFAQQEIDRLKGLVELAYQEGTKRHLFPDEHHFWPQFKQLHNI